jgi:hypothetical protein
MMSKPGDESAISLLGGMFGNRTSAQAIATLLLESQRINKDAGLIGGAKGMDAAPDLLKNDPTAVMNNFKNSWDNLLTSFGSPLVPIGLQAMNSLADVMKSLTTFAVAHPEAIKLVGEAILGLGAALIVLGGAAVIGAAAALIPGGMVAVAVVAIGTVLTSIAAFNWQGVKGALTGIYDAVADFINKIASLPGMITNALGIGGNGPARPKDGGSAPDWSAPGAGGRGVHPSSWVPPSNDNQPTVIHTALNIDGRRVATAVSQHMAANSSWSNSSSSFDGRAMASPTDVSYI